MRMDEYQKWLESQFVDDEEESVAAETVAIAVEEPPAAIPGAIAEADSAIEIPAPDEAIVPSEPAVSQERIEFEGAAPTQSAVEVAAEPVQGAAFSESSTNPSWLQAEVPSLERYFPHLLGPESAKLAHPVQVEPVEQLPVVAMTAAVPGVEETVPEATGPLPTPTRVTLRPRRARHARNVSPKKAPSDGPISLWTLVPKHIQVLVSLGDGDVAQNSYSRKFKESRLDLINRLLDPTLSLEDTARLLNVCPTTVRRYTNRGLLTHQRTTGDQRRFKLSDVLAFLEAQAVQPATQRDSA